EMLARNDVASDDLVSIMVTATDDLTAGYPASAIRSLGFDDVPLLGARELAVDGGLARCVRVLVHCYSARSRREVVHVYLEDARSFRPDLPECRPSQAPAAPSDRAVSVSRVTVLGTGLIGASVGLAARAAGHVVCGFDPDIARLERAREVGALD